MPWPVKKPTYVIVTALVFLAAACAHGDAGLSTAKQRWYTAQVADYNWTVEVACMCQIPPTYAVRVRGGIPIRFAQNGLASGTVSRFTVNAPPLTVEELFSVIDREVALDADKLAVTFDEALGYPSHIEIDEDVQGQDDESEFTVTAFEKL